MRFAFAGLLAVLPFAVRSDAKSYAHEIDLGPCGMSDPDVAGEWLAGFISLRARDNDQRYDEVIKELMKVQCGRDLAAEIERIPVFALLPFYAWHDSLDVRCGCLVAGGKNVACGGMWIREYELRK